MGEHAEYNYTLAIDQGGHASRTFVYDHQGQLIAEGHCEVETHKPQTDWVEHDPEALLSSITTAINQAIAALGDEYKNITCAGLATQRSNICCWDKITGKALSPIISWQDRRASDWIKQFSDKADYIHNSTGLYPNAHYGASKLHWCLENITEVQTAFETNRLAWGPMSSFIIYHLLDEKPMLSDPVNASRTLLWDIKQQDWSPEMLTLFNSPRSPLPSCVATNHRFGTLTIKDHTIPMTIVTGDQSASLYAYGTLETDTVYITIGTGAFIQSITNELPTESHKLLTSMVMQNESEATYAIEGTVNGAGSALHWIISSTGLHNAMGKLPEWLNSDQEPPLFLNGISGLGSPFWISDFQTCFVGDGEDWQKVVAVIESIVFLLKINLEHLRSISSAPKKIMLGGGLANIDGLCQRLANICSLPVFRPALHETTSRGLAFLLSEQPDDWSEKNTGRWFNPMDSHLLKARYLRWKKVLLAVIAQQNIPS